ncbi:MAG: PA14 domain-containing protein [Candidatus Brocadiia bacterium]
MTQRRILAGLAAILLALVAGPAAEAAFIGTEIGSTWGGSSSGTPPGPITVTGNGKDIWESADAFHYYHDAWSGNFNAVVRLLSQESTDGWAKAGIMARETTAANSQHAHVSATPSNGVALQWRDNNGGSSGWPNTRIPGSPNSGAAPFWMSLSRRGSTFTARWAPDDGGDPGWWSEAHTHNNAMPDDIRLGLSVTSHTTGSTSTCEFDGFLMGNWQTGASLSVAGPKNPRVMGQAYAQDRDSGDVLGPVHWKIDRLIPLVYDGPGVKNEWFPNESHTPPLVVPPFPTDEINWWSGHYPPEVGWSGNHNNFSVRYTGQFFADHDGTYAFEEHVDDEAWLWIDGSQVIHNSQWDVDTTGTIDLLAGWHDLEFRTREAGGGDFGRLRWDPDGGTDWAVMDVDNADLYTSFDYTETIVETLAEGWGNVGDPLDPDYFGLFLDQPEDYHLRLTVDYFGETSVAEGTFRGVPEPATCLVLGGGLLALARRRRRRRS